MDVAAWLRDLGLEAYVEAFALNGVDVELLGDLNNEDLKDLGIAKLADRKRLLNAIAGLAADSTGTDARPSQPATAAGERRQVTVLFADIAGFTRLTTELGAENIHSLLSSGTSNESGPRSAEGRERAATAPPCGRSGMASILLLFMGQFALFTYLRPFLESATGLDIRVLSAALLMMGTIPQGIPEGASHVED